MTSKSQKARSRKKKNQSSNMSHHLDRNVVPDSSPPNALDVALSKSFAQLDLSSDGPISRLPNELVQEILTRVDMQELIHLRMVCKKWMAVIRSIGHTKKSLWLTESEYDNEHEHDDVNYLKKRSFGQIDLNTFTTIKLKSYPSLKSHLVNLFPNIESIAMDLPLSNILTILPQFPLNQLATISILKYFSRDYGFSASTDEYQKLLTLINLAVSLKRLDIKVLMNCSMSILAPTLARLEQFSYLTFEPSLFGYFGPNCSRVSFGRFGEDFNFDHTINGQWLANVTHLDLKNVLKLDRVIEYFSKHAVGLEVLQVEVGSSETASPRLSHQMIGHLAKLKHLTEIDLNRVYVEWTLLDMLRRDFHLAQLASLRTCTLTIISMTTQSTNSYQLVSVLSTILPNVHHLNITINDLSFGILQGVESYLDYFAELQTHSFKVFQLNFRDF